MKRDSQNLATGAQIGSSEDDMSFLRTEKLEDEKWIKIMKEYESRPPTTSARACTIRVSRRKKELPPPEDFGEHKEVNNNRQDHPQLKETPSRLNSPIKDRQNETKEDNHSVQEKETEPTTLAAQQQQTLDIQ